MASIDMSLFLQNIRAALINQQRHYAQNLLEYAIVLAEQQEMEEKVVPLFPLDVSIGLHQGRVRPVNEDCVLALSGMLPDAEHFGLYVVCDGMGGHTHGQEAAYLAIQTLLEHVFPLIVGDALPSDWEEFLVKGIEQANRIIYQRNHTSCYPAAADVPFSTSHIQRMGTTMTVALLIAETAYIANVGDSRTYLYNRQGLSRITKDHSLVALYQAEGEIQEEEIYTHPQRNQITRALGVKPLIEVDTFVVPLSSEAILFLCSDGLWEMTRDRKIGDILACPWSSASFMTHQLVQLANNAGGADNISCIVVQLQRRTDISSLETRLLEPITVLNRL